MSGAIVALSEEKAIGWALHPYLSEYRVLIHLVHHTRIIKSALADQPAPAGSEAIHPGKWFSFGLADLKLSSTELATLNFMIGETDEIIATEHPRQEFARLALLTVEDMINSNTQRHWVNGSTYVEAEQAGLCDADIIDLLYRDLLGRAADPEGLGAYVFQRQRGIRSFADIRKSLIESDEYRQRPKKVAQAPGAVFSQKITLLAAGPIEEPENPVAVHFALPPPHPPAQSTSDQSAIAYWPSYAERLTSAPLQDAEPRPPAGLEQIEVELPADSVLFGSGWHNVEYLEETAFRWMETTGTVFSPKPNLSCAGVMLHVADVYGAHIPMVDCFLDEDAAEVAIEEQSRGFMILVRPPGGQARPYTKLRIQSRVSGCPLQDDKGADSRVLSLNVATVVVTYQRPVA